MKIEQGTGGSLYTFQEYELDQYVAKITQPLRDEIESLKIRLSLAKEDGGIRVAQELKTARRTKKIKKMKEVDYANKFI